MYESELLKLDANQWESFAQDVLFHLGFTILMGPSIGPDDGLDMVVSRERVCYLVSCKHYLKSGKSVGVSDETNILDRIVAHNCQGFITFYSTGSTSGLKRRLRDLSGKGVKIIELYKSEIMDIMPTMMGLALQKYFPRPQDISHHINDELNYKPLYCMKEGCEKDILEKKNMAWSMASLLHDEEDNELHLIFGCKRCINEYPEIGWAEITQIRYVEQLLGFRSLIDTYISKGIRPASDFYTAWACLQEGITQVLIPPGWGRWLG